MHAGSDGSSTRCHRSEIELGANGWSWSCGPKCSRSPRQPSATKLLGSSSFGEGLKQTHGLVQHALKTKTRNTHFCVYFHVHTHPHPFNCHSIPDRTTLQCTARLIQFLNISLTCSEKDTLTDLYQHTTTTQITKHHLAQLLNILFSDLKQCTARRQNSPSSLSIRSPPGMPPKEVSSDNIYLFLMQTGQPSVRSPWAQNRFQSVLRGVFLCVLKFILM